VVVVEAVVLGDVSFPAPPAAPRSVVLDIGTEDIEPAGLLLPAVRVDRVGVGVVVLVGVVLGRLPGGHAADRSAGSGLLRPPVHSRLGDGGRVVVEVAGPTALRTLAGLAGTQPVPGSARERR
jgi:hypothetical protein